MAKTLGEFLMLWRKRAKVSQREAATATGVLRQTVTQWEADKTIPRADRLTALLQLYKVPEGEWPAIMKGGTP